MTDEHPSRNRGNNPGLWDKLLSVLDERLQLGLLDRLRRVASYHFEDQILLIEAGSPEDEKYLSRPTVLQQLQLLAQDAVGVEKLTLREAKK